MSLCLLREMTIPDAAAAIKDVQGTMQGDLGDQQYEHICSHFLNPDIGTEVAPHMV